MSGSPTIVQDPLDTSRKLKVNADGSINVTAAGAGDAVTVADGADITQGAKADAAWSGTGDATIAALLKALATVALSAQPSLVEQEDITATGSITTQNLSPTGAATAGSAVEILCYGKGTVSIDVSGTYTGVLSVQATIDGVNWRTLLAGQAIVSDISNSTTALSATIASAAVGIWRVGSAGYTKMRVSGLAAMTGTAVVTLRASPGVFGIEAAGLIPVFGPQAHDAVSNANPVRIAGRALTADYAAVSSGDVADFKTTLVGALIEKPYAIPELDWSYAAAAGGITNTTTAVLVKAAAAAGIRNYVTSMQISSDALGSATEFAIRDGAAGTVLWRGKIGTAGVTGGEPMVFPSPLRGTAATLLEVVTLTASITGAVYVNLQGYTAP